VLCAESTGLGLRLTARAIPTDRPQDERETLSCEGRRYQIFKQ